MTEKSGFVNELVALYSLLPMSPPPFITKMIGKSCYIKCTGCPVFPFSDAFCPFFVTKMTSKSGLNQMP
eukprot:14262008-Ditylum_brightwellii.AAC.1